MLVLGILWLCPSGVLTLNTGAKNEIKKSNVVDMSSQLAPKWYSNAGGGG